MAACARRVIEILNRHPAVGLALGVIRGGRLESFHGHGLADLESGRPITDDTAFRIGSVTKLFTAVAVMQLWERGLVDLDAPANEYLRAFRLRPARPGLRPVTIRHLLTHTSGIPDVRHPFDLLHFDWGPFEGRPPLLSVPIGEPLPTLAEYYRAGLASVVEPGMAFAYSNHGFATLGQIVEDVSGLPLDRYLREHIFDPLDMDTSDLRRSQRIVGRLATGYALGRGGPEPVPDRDWIGAGGGGIYSTSADIGRFVTFLLDPGAGGGRTVLHPATLATMLQPQWLTDERVTSIGLGFFLNTVGGHRLAGHEGILPGFNSQLLIAPDDGLGVVAFTNGSSGAMSWLPAEVTGLLLDLLGVPAPRVRTDIAPHPELWPDLCGRYRLPGADFRPARAHGHGSRSRGVCPWRPIDGPHSVANPGACGEALLSIPMTSPIRSCSESIRSGRECRRSASCSHVVTMAMSWRRTRTSAGSRCHWSGPRPRRSRNVRPVRPPRLIRP